MSVLSLDPGCNRAPACNRQRGEVSEDEAVLTARMDRSAKMPLMDHENIVLNMNDEGNWLFPFFNDRSKKQLRS